MASTQEKPAIQVKNLKKFYKVYRKEPGLAGSLKSLVSRRYETVRAVDGISFSIQPGELVGFIGPNGAGKTTTLKVLSGLLYPDGGLSRVLGYDPYQRRREFQKQFSLVMGQKNQLWWDLPAYESFVLNKEIYEVSDEDFETRLKELADLLDANDILKVQVRKLSLGQRMKCELIAALLHAPQVLFLDEPTIGLDVVAQKNLRDFIREYNQRHRAAIVLTSHYMGDVRELCERVIIIDKGKLSYDGRLGDIVKKYADHKILEAVFSKPVEEGELSKIGQVETFEFPEATIKVPRQKASLLAAELLAGFPVVDLNIVEVPIEDIIREIFTGKNVGRNVAQT